jgi:TrpR family trp operon transcriptional repressor
MSSLETAILAAETPSEIKAFLSALLTPEEVEEVGNRWAAMQLVSAGMTQRAVAKELGIAIATVSRAARAVRENGPIVRLLVKRSK